MMTKQTYLGQVLDVWAPNWPRRVGKHQDWAHTHDEAVGILDREMTKGGDGYISTYSFPRGHTREGNVPHVDTLFIDFDIEGREYKAGSGDRDAWIRDLSFLLVRARRVAKFLLEREAPGWRAAFSGHKGIHLFLDFPAVDPDIGDYNQFAAGLSEYARELTGHLMQETGITDLSDYVDVTSGDLGRLHRVPNTRHPGASESFGEDRYCVAVTLEELANATPEFYEEATRQPRRMDGLYESRNPNERAGENVAHHIATASPGKSASFTDSMPDPERYDEYVSEVQNEAIDLDDVEFLTSDRPCVWEFYKREDKYSYGNQSRFMEIYCIRELQEKNVPVDVIREFLSNSPEYDKDYTEWIIKDVISRDYNRFSIEKLMSEAPEFAGPCEGALI